MLVVVNTLIAEWLVSQAHILQHNDDHEAAADLFRAASRLYSAAVRYDLSNRGRAELADLANDAMAQAVGALREAR